MTRVDVKIPSAGEVLAGWFYEADTAPGEEQRPLIVMAHGLGAIKEMYLPPVAQKFFEAGFAVLVFDFRCYGGSTGEPREQAFPAEQLEDFRNAISFGVRRPGVNPDCVGVWGTSGSGGLVLEVAAYDPRVKAVVSQTPLIDFYEAALRAVGPEGVSGFLAVLQADRDRRYEDPTPAYIPFAAPTGEAAFQSNSLTHEWVSHAQQTVAPSFQNRITMESIERLLEWAPGSAASRIAPAALMFVVATRDGTTHPDLIEAAFERAADPKEIVRVESNHYEIYTGAAQAEATEHATRWFIEQLARPASA